MAKRIDLNALPKPARLGIMFGLPFLIASVSFFLLINPKLKVINKLEAEINKQRTEIADKKAKAERLDLLIKENELLKKRLAELLEQLPEEKEVSSLLREVSLFGQNSGLEITLWKPFEKKVHTSNIVYEIPVSIEATGSFNNFGSFLERIALMKRIVNIPDIKMSFQKQKEDTAELKIAFHVVTYSAIPESEAQQAGAQRPGVKR